jgi:transposase
LFSEAIIMSESTLIGIDLGKHSFHLHGQDKLGREVFRKKLSRQQMMTLFGNLPACTVVMEACAGVTIDFYGAFWRASDNQENSDNSWL